MIGKRHSKPWTQTPETTAALALSPVHPPGGFLPAAVLACTVFAAALAGGTPPPSASPHPPAVTSTLVDAAGLNFPQGPYGSCINGQTFQQEALVSFRGFQYAAYFREGGVLCLARRRLSGTSWETLRFPDPPIRHRDVHNVAVIGLCPADGTLHLAFDHHNSPLHYKLSVAGLATHPDQFAWDAALFGPTRDALVHGQPLAKVTYPLFFPTPEGKLQLLLRLGSSGDGDWHLAEYDPASPGWSMPGVLFSREGLYGTSASRCAYPNPLRYGPDGRLHVTWCWRERPAGGPTDLRTNHDLGYAWSGDRGRSWHNNAGELVARLEGSSLPGKSVSIHVHSPGVIAWPTPYLWGQMNTTTQFVDPAGRVHAVHWQQPQEAAGPSVDQNTWRYDHYWREASGTWHRQRLPFTGRKPQIAVDRAGTAYLIFCRSDNLNYHGQDPGGVLTIAQASEETQWRDWKVQWTSPRLHAGEPLLDQGLFETEGILSIYTQEKPVQPGAPSPLHVIDVRPGRL